MRRFVSNFALEIDATFNTNRLKILLFILVGITYTEKSFSGTFSFGGAENVEFFTFIFKCLRKLVFIDDISFFRILVSDQTTRLISIMPVEQPETISQLYKWHAVENIRKRITSKKYLKEKREEIYHQT